MDPTGFIYCFKIPLQSNGKILAKVGVFKPFSEIVWRFYFNIHWIYRQEVERLVYKTPMHLYHTKVQRYWKEVSFSDCDHLIQKMKGFADTNLPYEQVPEEIFI
jgi:hypothetical protein